MLNVRDEMNKDYIEGLDDGIEVGYKSIIAAIKIHKFETVAQINGYLHNKLEEMEKENDE